MWWLVAATGQAQAKRRRQTFQPASPVQSAEPLEGMFHESVLTTTGLTSSAAMSEKSRLNCAHHRNPRVQYPITAPSVIILETAQNLPFRQSCGSDWLNSDNNDVSVLFAYCLGDGGGGHWLVRMEWRPAGWSVCLPLLILPCNIKSRSSLLAPAHLGGPGKGP